MTELTLVFNLSFTSNPPTLDSDSRPMPPDGGPVNTDVSPYT